MKTRILVASTLALLSLSAAGAAFASTHAEQNGEKTPAAEAQMIHSVKIGLDQAKAIAQKAVPGTVADIGFNDENGRPVWEAQVIDAKGQEHTVKIDAMSGQVLSTTSESAQETSEESDHGQMDGEHMGEDQETQDGTQQ